VESPSLLTPSQKAFLTEFFKQPVGQEFFLTGGTALAEYYLHHRYSEDIDLFTLNEVALHQISASLPAIALNLGATYEDRFRTSSFRQVFVRIGQDDLKIDLVRDVGTQFGEHRLFGNVIVDSELNIAVNKVTAIFGRTTPKDFVDLYFLLKKGYPLAELLQMAKEKDLGFTEFYFASMLRQGRSLTTMPRMIVPLTVEELRPFFEELATQIMVRLKPPE